MDRLSDYISSINLGDKRNIVSSIAAGALFSLGWWLAIDAAFAYPNNEDLLKASHTCGALATVALIMINSVTNNQVRGESMYNEGFFGKTCARVWIFLGFLLSFGSLISAVWIFFAYYVANDKKFAPGISILLQNVFIFASTQLFKFGRNEELWAN